MSLLELLQGWGIFSVGVAALAWLARTLIRQMISRDLEAFKSNLEKEATEYRIRYERLHTERVVVIKEVYKKIVRAHESLRSLINPCQGVDEPSLGEKGETAGRSNRELIAYYQENRIFFEEQLAKKIDSLLSKLYQAWNEFDLSQSERSGGDPKAAQKAWEDAWKQIDKDVPRVKSELENNFRGTLGIKIDSLC